MADVVKGPAPDLTLWNKKDEALVIALLVTRNLDRLRTQLLEFFPTEKISVSAAGDLIVLSGEVGVTKPDARIFEALCTRYGLEPATTLFIDDNPPNVDGAVAAGLQALRFESAATLRGDLSRLGLLDRD